MDYIIIGEAEMNKIDHAVVHTETTTTYFDADGNKLDTIKTYDNHFVNFKIEVKDSIDNTTQNLYNKGG